MDGLATNGFLAFCTVTLNNEDAHGKAGVEEGALSSHKREESGKTGNFSSVIRNTYGSDYAFGSVREVP